MCGKVLLRKVLFYQPKNATIKPSMAEQFPVMTFPKDAFITVEEGNKIAEHFFIIREGKVRRSKAVPITINADNVILGPGDFFGVVSTMSGHKYIDTIQAVTDVTLITVHRNQFGQLIQNNTPVAIKILIHFSRRMRSLNETLAVLTFNKNTSADTGNLDAGHLFNVAEYYTKQGQYNLAYYTYNQYIKLCPSGENVQTAQEHKKKITPNVKIDRLGFRTHDQLSRTYHKDTMIFAEGEPGEEIFIIKSGSVKIAKVTKDKEVLLAVLRTGDIFGEMALLESKPRGANAIAYEDCEIMAVNRTNFDHMIKTQPQLIARLTTMLAERIWLTHKQLANTRINDSLGRIYDMLFVQLEKKHINPDDDRSYTFDFSTKELIDMAGLSQNDGNLAIQKLLQNRFVDLVQGRLCITDVPRFSKQTTSYLKNLETEKGRKEH